MQTSSSEFLRCNEPGCDFTYSKDDKNALRNHKSCTHVTKVKVTYSAPLGEAVLLRTGEKFQCISCSFTTRYPSVIQKHAKTCTVSPPSSPRPAITLSPVPLQPPTLSLSCSPPELATLHPHDYHPIPDKRTVVQHPPFNLPAIGIVINLHFRCIICVNCQRAINASNLIEHLRKDLPLVEVPEDLPSILETTYQLVPYSSIVYSSTPIPPVFGIPLEPNPMYFCDCGKGLATFETLRIHQTRSLERPCLLRGNNRSFHIGYAQRLTSNRPFFEVDPKCWYQDSDPSLHYPLLFSRSLPPLRDYSKMEIKGAEDEMNTSSFFFSQRWLDHLDGYSPEEILEVTQQTSEDAPYGKLLRQVGEEFLLLANAQIKKHSSFGLLKLMGQTTERETLHRFDFISSKTVEKYALTLHRLIFGVLRQMDPSYPHSYRYPQLHSTQLVSLQALKDALNAKQPIPDLIDLYQAACFSLFAHHQHQYDTSRDLNQFFSPVICFLVVSSVRERGDFQLPSVITQYIAHIMFAMRSVMLFEVIKKAKNENIGLSEAYSSFKQYLTSGHETPMAYYYNAVTLLSVIRSDETNEARFSCTDMSGREFSYEGNIIRVDDIAKMINNISERYTREMKAKCFFGQDTPDSLSLSFNPEDLVDNLQNTHSGYSFLDDPRNPFLVYRSSYGEWLLSDQKRAAQFVYTHGDQLVWKPRPCFDLLVQMQEIRQLLLLLCIFTAGPSSRASEVARQLLRNVPGSYRNLLILFHVICLVDIQDKTSHKHLRDKYVPHCPTPSVALLLIYNLVIFRPFEEYLVQILLGDEASLRYHQQLWPGLQETISDTKVSDAIGKECTRHLVTASSIGKVSYKILFWRNLVSAILKYRSDVRTNATHQQYYLDTAMMHSTSMAVARYGGDTNNLPMSDPRQVVECIKVGFAWQKILNIDQKSPHKEDLDDQLYKMESTLSDSTASNNPHFSVANIATISTQITNIVSSRLEDLVQETVMKAMAEMSHTYFPKVLPNPVNDLLDLSSITIPPCRLHQLRTFLKNPRAQFTCPEQAVLLELMLRRTQSVLAVLGTGTGKTLTILLQAFLQNNLTTIVVLPLSTLHDDLKRRAAALGVSYSRWSPKGKFSMNVNVISVSIEELGYQDFIKFLADLEHHHRLGPIVFDEIHKIVTDSVYRDSFQNYHALHTVKAVVFGLTGSLPPSLYSVLCELTAMTWQVIRTPSSRKEFKYQVVRVSLEKDMDMAIVAHLHDAISTYRKEDRAIVFCRSKHQVTALAKLFKVHPYYAPGDDEDILRKNKEALIQWVSGENQIMTSTSILGCGFDYPHIRDVVHRDPSYSMLDQYQEDSRGGRDGLECRATTFVVDKKKYPVPSQPYDLGTQVLFKSMYETVQCQRIAPSLYLDGRGVQCITLQGSVFCDFCEKSAAISSGVHTSSHNLPAMVTIPSSKQVSLSSVAQEFIPPRRSLDLFDPSPRSPRIDLRDYIHPLKRRTDSSKSTETAKSSDLNSSPAKKVKFSDTTTLYTSSPKALNSPVSPTLNRAALSYRPLLSNQAINPSLRLAHPAGIQARHHQLAGQERLEDFNSKVNEPVIKAVTFLADKCVMCWMNQRKDWREHPSDKCPKRTGTNYGDPAFVTFRSGAFRLLDGWCFTCLLHQKRMTHPFISPKECPWRGIVIRVIYMFTILSISCPIIPDTLDFCDIQDFREWLCKDPGEYPGIPFHNGLKLFLWLAYDFYKINEEQI